MGRAEVTIGRAVLTKDGKTSLHIPLWQVGQVARGRRAVGAGKGVAFRFLRGARPETPHGIGVSGLGVVEFWGKFPKNLSVLPEQTALMGGTCRLFCPDLPSFFHFHVHLPNSWATVWRDDKNCLPLRHVITFMVRTRSVYTSFF